MRAAIALVFSNHMLRSAGISATRKISPLETRRLPVTATWVGSKPDHIVKKAPAATDSTPASANIIQKGRMRAAAEGLTLFGLPRPPLKASRSVRSLRLHRRVPDPKRRRRQPLEAQQAPNPLRSQSLQPQVAEHRSKNRRSPPSARSVRRDAPQRIGARRPCPRLVRGLRRTRV